ncbi:hypothetical protein AMAG_16636 [Allomyces macrogynus ATCC 38327]|uniref:Uncharacterized protein n=1 Tax=Allomyces macrogynus (strain ATCC 38327) TaxID=578462 RepID=A0A0L0TC71_ALLM3|nr:hypothetical protein AMAG_16636 [Allomyces macrogynus ATCC 38327]|eukprot:KNE72144.1 hypothetical protein AMAG_16636 [Allomyces macrogynus ATCC 38327]
MTSTSTLSLLLLVALLAVSSAHGHMVMRDPPPRHSHRNPGPSGQIDYDDTSPLGTFPCKGYRAQKPVRTVKHPITIRMWDTYLSEDGDLNDFHVYVCAAFLVKWSKELRAMSFPDIMLFLQSPPTAEWGDKETELLLSEAFMWKSLFHNSPNHLAGK